MKRYVKAVLQAVGQELKVGALVMLIMLPIGLLVAVPIALAALYLPDWAWWSLFGCACLCWLFGDTVSWAIRREKESRP